VGRYQKGKTNLDFTLARDSEWQWHQLGHMQVCISLQTYKHASTSTLSFLRAGCPSCRPTNGIKVLKTKATDIHVRKKGSLYSITERRVPELVLVLGSQPAGDVSHKPGGRLPLLSVTPATLKRATTSFAAWWTEAGWVWTVCLRLLPDSVATAIWTRAWVQHANHSADGYHVYVVCTKLKIGRVGICSVPIKDDIVAENWDKN